ncbi:MAG TPA: guanylate kinase [Candidatus Moranbacteria bacterium]|nr:guanylate kinase [Candidatus Moranbacteria bacterium]
MKKSKIIIIAGPTGCGESTVTKEIIKKFPKFKRLVTATTRMPRLNEKNKIDYYFFSKKRFKNEIEKGNILEYTYIKNRDTYYGTYKKDLEKKLNSGFSLIINPDVIGAKFFKENYRAVTIFVKPESIESLKKRLMDRDPNISQTELKKRLENAKKEIKNEERFYDYTIINKYGKLNQAVKEVIKIIKKNNV